MPDIWMDVDAALSEVSINKIALIDDTDFKTREESVVYNQSGLDLVWNFVTTAGAMSQTAVTPTDTAGDYDFVNQGNGMYTIEIPASGGASINNDTEGFGWFTGFATGILPWAGPVIGFRAAALNNALIDGGSRLEADLTHVMGTILTEGAGGRLAAAIIKLFDVATPTLVSSDVMRGTEDAATEAKQDILDTNVDTLITRITAAVALASVCTEGRLAELDAGNLPTDVAAVPTAAEIDTQLIGSHGSGAWTTGAGGSDRLLMVDTTIATLASQTSFTLTAGSADNDAYNNCTIVIEDVSTSTQKAVGIVSDYIGASKTITLKYDPGIFTMATTDKVYILAENALKTTLANRQLNVAADGDIAGDIDGNVDGTVAIVTTLTNLPSIPANWLTAAGIAASALDGKGDWNINKTGYSLSTAAILAIWHQLNSAIVTAGSMGKLLKDEITSARMATLTDWIDGNRLDLLLDLVLADTADMQPLIEKMAYVGSHGLGVWIDDGAANTNTVLGTDGTPDNPVSTIAAATTVATSLGSQRFYLINDTQITLAQTYEGYEFIGVGVSNLITLGSQDVDNTLFRNVVLTGTQGGTQFMRAIDCQLQAILSAEILADNCWITGDITLRAATNHSFGNCKSGMPGNDTPDLTFPGSGTTSVNFRHYSGGLTVKSATSSDTMSYEADGQIIIDASCTSLTIAVRGVLSITDNGTTTSLTQDAAVNRTNINAEADTALTDYDPPTNAEMEARTPTAAQLLYITRHAATALPVTFADGGSTTQAILVNVDGAGASGTDDVYNGRVLVFNTGTLDEQVTDITDYDGGTKTATITAVTTSVVSSHTAVMV